MDDLQEVKLLFVHVHDRMHMQSVDEPLARKQLDGAQDSDQSILIDPFCNARIVILGFDPASNIN